MWVSYSLEVEYINVGLSYIAEVEQKWGFHNRPEVEYN